MDREKVIKDLEECLSASCRGFRPRLSCPYNDEEWNIMRDVLDLLKEQEHKDMMYHALEDDWKRLKELLKEQEERIKSLEHQLETITKWRTNAGAFD